MSQVCSLRLPPPHPSHSKCSDNNQVLDDLKSIPTLVYAANPLRSPLNLPRSSVGSLVAAGAQLPFVPLALHGDNVEGEMSRLGTAL